MIPRTRVTTPATTAPRPREPDAAPPQMAFRSTPTRPWPHINRLGLEKLCRYGMRPAFSHQRLSLTEQGKVLYSLRRPWPTAGGVSALCFDASRVSPAALAADSAALCAPHPILWPLCAQPGREALAEQVAGSRAEGESSRSER